MAVLPNPKLEAFAAAVAAGESAAGAYKSVYRCKRQAAETNGPALLRDAQVALRGDEIRAIANQVATEKLKLTKEEVLQFLADVLRRHLSGIWTRTARDLARHSCLAI